MSWTPSLFPSIRDHLKEYNQVQRTVVLIHLADWLEHNLDNGTLYYPQSKSAWFRENYEILLDLTAILHQPVLPTAYQQVQQENTAIDMPEGFQLAKTNTSIRCLVPNACRKRFAQQWQEGGSRWLPRLKQTTIPLRREIGPTIKTIRNWFLPM